MIRIRVAIDLPQFSVATCNYRIIDTTMWLPAPNIFNRFEISYGRFQITAHLPDEALVQQALGVLMRIPLTNDTCHINTTIAPRNFVQIIQITFIAVYKSRRSPTVLIGGLNWDSCSSMNMEYSPL